MVLPGHRLLEGIAHGVFRLGGGQHEVEGRVNLAAGILLVGDVNPFHQPVAGVVLGEQDLRHVLAGVVQGRAVR